MQVLELDPVIKMGPESASQLTFEILISSFVILVVQLVAVPILIAQAVSSVGGRISFGFLTAISLLPPALAGLVPDSSWALGLFLRPVARVALLATPPRLVSPTMTSFTHSKLLAKSYRAIILDFLMSLLQFSIISTL
jgi:hypothetical protein